LGIYLKDFTRTLGESNKRFIYSPERTEDWTNRRLRHKMSRSAVIATNDRWII